MFVYANECTVHARDYIVIAFIKRNIHIHIHVYTHTHTRVCMCVCVYTHNRYNRNTERQLTMQLILN